VQEVHACGAASNGHGLPLWCDAVPGQRRIYLGLVAILYTAGFAVLLLMLLLLASCGELLLSAENHSAKVSTPERTQEKPRPDRRRKKGIDQYKGTFFTLSFST
jgi:hypothetical protein